MSKRLVVQILLVSSLVSMVIFTVGYYILSETTLFNGQLGNGSIREEMEFTPTLGEIPEVVAKAIPAVVSISISATVPVYERYYENFWSPFGEGFGFRVPRQRQVGTEEQEIGGGTGFIVSPDGYIVTNKHVVNQEGVDYTIITNDGTTYDVEIVAKDPTFDVAILKINADKELPFLTFADINNVRLGETVIAIGNALAEFPNSVSVGVVSGLSRDIVAGNSAGFQELLEGVIQTDAAINSGNSGGPLINMNGEVIGVNVAVAGGENIGFALPADVVKSIFDTVLEYGEIIRPFLGVRYIQITEAIARSNNLPVDYGVLILGGDTPEEVAVLPGSPADQAGLRENDIILEIDGERLEGSPSLASLLRQYEAGETITLKVIQDGEEKEIDVTLEAREVIMTE